MQFFLLWLLAGVVVFSVHVTFFLPAVRIRAAIPRRLYVVFVTVVTAPLALALHISTGLMEWIETASPSAGLREFRESLQEQYESTLEAWHGR